MAQEGSSPATQPSPRFTQELEFVLSLANPSYLQFLAVTYPHIFNPSQPSSTTSSRPTASKEDNTDSAKFTRYLKYLHDYWSTPTYSQFLTHPAATLRHLQLLQIEQFRRDLIRPDLLPRLAEGYTGVEVYQPPGTAAPGNGGQGDNIAEGNQSEAANGEAKPTETVINQPRILSGRVDPESGATYGGETSADLLRNRALAARLETMSEEEWRQWMRNRSAANKSSAG